MQLKTIKVYYKAITAYALFNLLAICEIVVLGKNSNAEIIIGLLISFLILGPINTAFLLLLYYLNIFRRCLNSIYWMILELFFYFTLGYLFNYITDIIPKEILFSITKTATVKRVFFSDWSIIFYEYIVMLTFFYIVEKLSASNAETK